MPYTTSIKPVINEGVYIALRALISHELPDPIVIKELPALFIVYAHKHFKMAAIAGFLGVSIRRLYRLIGAEYEYGKIAMLVFHLFNSYDYSAFIESCRRIHIIVRKE